MALYYKILAFVIVNFKLVRLSLLATLILVKYLPLMLEVFP